MQSWLYLVRETKDVACGAVFKDLEVWIGKQGMDSLGHKGCHHEWSDQKGSDIVMGALVWAGVSWKGARKGWHAPGPCRMGETDLHRG